MAREGGQAGTQRRTIWLMRGLWVAAVVILALILLKWRAILVECDRGVRLYHDGAYAEAEDMLVPLLYEPLARLLVRSRTLSFLRRCRLRMATEAVRNDYTLAGYMKALELLNEASVRYGESPRIARRIEYYRKIIEALSQPPEPEHKEMPKQVFEGPEGFT